MANLVFQPCSTTEVQVAILEPICREVGLATWFKELTRHAEKEFGKLRESLKKLVLHPKVKQPQLRVRRNRNLRWRGDELPDGRISASIAIPNDCVEEILARSGCNGTIYDLPGAAEMDKFNLAKVKLPNDLTMQQAIAKVDELGAELKKYTRGIVPTYKGYAVRTLKSKEAEITRALTPEIAAELGQALGMEATSKWKIKGLPSYISKGALHAACARSSMEWPGWIIRPIKTLAAARNDRRDKVDWLVEAANNPPMKTITINSKHIACIEEHFDKPTKRVAAWFAAPKVEAVPKSIWELPTEPKHPEYFNMEVDQSEASDKEQREERNNEPSEMAVDQTNATHVSRKRGAGACVNVDDSAIEDPTKQLIAFMKSQSEQAKKEAEQKDQLIADLLGKIDYLTSQVAALSSQLSALKKSNAGSSDDEV